jgi:hypothetical protein
MQKLQRHELPNSYPAFIETEAGFISIKHATVAHCHEQLRINRRNGEVARSVVSKLLRLAKIAHLADDQPLVPALEALAASGNVVVLSRGA